MQRPAVVERHRVCRQEVGDVQRRLAGGIGAARGRGAEEGGRKVARGIERVPSLLLFTRGGGGGGREAKREEKGGGLGGGWLARVGGQVGLGARGKAWSEQWLPAAR